MNRDRSIASPSRSSPRRTGPWRSLFVSLWCCSCAAACASEGTLTIVLDGGWAAEPVFLEIAVADPWKENGASCEDLLSLEAPLNTAEPAMGMDIVQQHGIALDPLDELPRLGVLRDGALVAARARDLTCTIVGQGCTRIRLVARDQEVRVALLPGDPDRCPEGTRCEDGRPGECIFGDCVVDEQCIDVDPATTNLCVDFFCATSTDADEDLLPSPLDCDDLDAYIPQDDPSCGHAMDHDCDGVVDDLDGCGVPTCGRYEIVDLHGPDPSDTTLYGHAAYGVFVSGDRVVAVLTGSEDFAPIVVWLGTLTPEGALVQESSAIAIEFDDDGDPVLDDDDNPIPVAHLVPRELAVYRDWAFVSNRDAVDVFDLSESVVTHVGQLPEPAHVAVDFKQLAVAPPFLFVGVTSSVLQYDLSQVAPVEGWPVFLGEIGGLRGVADVSVRSGSLLTAGLVSSYLAVLSPLWYGEEDRVVRNCYNLDSEDDADADRACYSAECRIERIARSADGATFIAASHVVRNPIEEAPERLLFVLTGDPNGSLTAVPTGGGAYSDAVVLGLTEEVAETVLLEVVGEGLLLRSTWNDDVRGGLHLHSTESLGEWQTYPRHDRIWDVAVVGDRILLAAGTEGLLVGRLVCSE